MSCLQFCPFPSRPLQHPLSGFSIDPEFLNYADV
jgi:hypothetical protein